jgi:hypothetical protein
MTGWRLAFSVWCLVFGVWQLVVGSWCVQEVVGLCPEGTQGLSKSFRHTKTLIHILVRTNRQPPNAKH